MGRFRMAWRALRAAPLTSTAAVTLIAVGVGANSAVFAVKFRSLEEEMAISILDRRLRVVPAAGLRSLLYGVGPQDPVTLAAVVSFVCVVAVGAAVLPARQASRADPLELLRSE